MERQDALKKEEKEEYSNLPGEGDVRRTSLTSELGGRAETFENKVQGLIRTRPLLVMAGALAIGFVASRVVFQRKDQWI